MEYAKNEYFSAAGIGQNCTLYCTDGTRHGILSAVSEECVTYLSPDGQEKLQQRWENIDTIEFELPPATELDLGCMYWWKETMRKIKGPEFRWALSLSCQYRNFFDKLGAHDTKGILQDILNADSPRKRKLLYIKDQNELQKCLDELEQLLVIERASVAERFAARALVYFVAKDYISAFNELLPCVMALEHPTPQILLPVVCLYHEVGDSAGAFFWLMRYFEQKDVPQEDAPFWEDSVLWWGYLQYAVIHDYFPQVWEQIRHLSQTDTVLALRSMAFLFLLQGNRSKGELLYRVSCQPAPHISAGTFQAFYSALTHSAITEDWGSRFYRYYLRANQIISTGGYHAYNKDRHLQGYVYDFVESRGFCMVLGCDFISYFLHFDTGTRESDNYTPGIRRKLRKEITPMQSIRDELPIGVCFDRDRQIGPGKRCYHVTYAMLLS